MPYDLKYGDVKLEHPRNIGDDELVVVFRGKDRNLMPMLDNYLQLCVDNGSPLNHLELLQGLIKEVDDWQKEHGVHTPSSPGLTAAEVFGG